MGGRLVDLYYCFGEYDAVAIYVNDLNPVKALSLRQIDGIVTGAITNWKDVGGVNTPIVVYGEANAVDAARRAGVNAMEVTS